MSIYRLFEIIYILLRENKVPARELAEQLGVSRRTICRDIDTLSLAGVPVYAERGKGGGIGLLPDFVLNKSILTEQEQSEILSALHGLSNIKTSGTSQVLRKVSAIFNKTATNWLDVNFSDWGYENDFFKDLKIAIMERRIAQFDYYNSKGDKTFRRIEPMQLCFKSKSWYLSGFCLNKQDMRFYKLSRIKNLVITDEHFPHRDSLSLPGDPTEYFKEDTMVTLKLRIEGEMAYRVYDDFQENKVEKQPNGSFIVTAALHENNWLYGFLLSYGKHIEVLEPEHIRNIVKEEAHKILKKHL